jgi:hypothetical protein
MSDIKVARMSTSVNSVIIPEDNENPETPLLAPAFQPQPDVPVVPVPYVGRDPRFFVDFEAF